MDIKGLHDRLYSKEDFKVHYKYDIEKAFQDKNRIGSGGQGSVYELEGLKDKVIKLMQIESVKKMHEALKEIKMQMNLFDHPNIVKIYSAYSWQEKEDSLKLAIVLEKCDEDLESFIRKQKKLQLELDADLIIKWLLQALEAIHFMKYKKISHRDIKPKNLLVHERNIKIGDFGVAKFYSNTMHTLIGTREYLSPILAEALQQEAGEIQHNLEKSDIFSLGITFLQLTLLLQQGDMKNCNKNEKYVQDLLKRVKNENLKMILSKMVIFNENERPDLDQLLEKHFLVQLYSRQRSENMEIHVKNKELKEKFYKIRKEQNHIQSKMTIIIFLLILIFTMLFCMQFNIFPNKTLREIEIQLKNIYWQQLGNNISLNNTQLQNNSNSIKPAQIIQQLKSTEQRLTQMIELYKTYNNIQQQNIQLSNKQGLQLNQILQNQETIQSTLQLLGMGNQTTSNVTTMLTDGFQIQKVYLDDIQDDLFDFKQVIHNLFKKLSLSLSTEMKEVKDLIEPQFDLEYFNSEKMYELLEHKSAIRSIIAFGNKQQKAHQFLTASDDHTLKVWLLERNQSIFTLHGHSGSVLYTAILDQDIVASADSNSNIIIWDLSNPYILAQYSAGQPIAKQQNVNSSIIQTIKLQSLKKLINSSYLAYGDQFGNLYLWNWQQNSHHTVQVIYLNSTIDQLPQKIINSSNNSNDRPNNTNHNSQKHYIHKQNNLHLGDLSAIQQINTNLFVTSGGDSTIALWKIQPYNCQVTSNHSYHQCNQLIQNNSLQIMQLHRINLLIEYNTLILVEENLIAVGRPNGNIHLLRVVLNTITFDFKLIGHTQKVNSITNISKDLIASSSKDKTIKIWDWHSGNCIETLNLKNNNGFIFSLALLGDGSTLITGDLNGVIRIWH